MKTGIHVILVRLTTAFAAAAVIALALFMPAQAVYGSHSFPDYPTRSASQYSNKVIKGGLIVALETVEDLERQKLYFKSHLSSKGILPVFIVVQNTSATGEYLFDKSAVALGEATNPSGKGGRKIGSLLGSGGLLDLTLVRDATDVRENLMKKEVRSKTLSPGSSVYGFVYVPVPTDGPRKKLHLQVPITNSQSSETEVVNLFF
jgi:hypothetical protein